MREGWGTPSPFTAPLPAKLEATLRVGVDVGGTNTDGVLLDPFSTSEANRGILAWHKAPTTTNPSIGIEECITHLLTEAKVDPSRIASVTIGTTHFIYAVVEKDRNRLAPVAIIRLCGPFSRNVYPGIDWPADLRDIFCSYCSFVDGGLEIDGQIIREIVEEQIKAECEKIKELGIKAIVVNGIFSPSDLEEKQEERVGEWIAKYYPEADVVLFKHVANLGLVARENAAILNTFILPFARRTISSFQHAIASRLNLNGPTNSMCGAAFLVKPEFAEKEKRPLLVCDIGVTTTDVGMLLASGLPRQAAAITDVSGVMMNFSCPDVKSICLGGGSIVRKDSPTSKLTIGPDSVGHHIKTRAHVFGGDVPTATNYAVACAKVSGHSLDVGNVLRLPQAFYDNAEEYREVVKRRLENIIDRMKTNADDIEVLLVGGGAVLVNEGEVLKGVSKVIKPKFSGVANAIGAAIARISGTVDTVVSTEGKTTQQAIESVAQLAIDRAVENGAVRETIELAEMDAIPLQYIANKSRVIVKAIGDFDFAHIAPTPPPLAPEEASEGDTIYVTSGSWRDGTFCRGELFAHPTTREKVYTYKGGTS
ncbi:Hydantoinase/oxoprolinase N-terminal region-domain-containing protein [Schizophyllum commune]